MYLSPKFYRIRFMRPCGIWLHINAATKNYTIEPGLLSLHVEHTRNQVANFLFVHFGFLGCYLVSFSLLWRIANPSSLPRLRLIHTVLPIRRIDWIIAILVILSTGRIESSSNEQQIYEQNTFSIPQKRSALLSTEKKIV